MTRHYCTYFDFNYIAQGCALARSLFRHDPEAVLWVLCLDDETRSVLRELDGERIRTLALSSVEDADPQLRAARANRSWVEYLFTLSPCLPLHVLREEPAIDVLTYLDADVWVFSNPAVLLSELGSGNVLIVEHGFPPWLRHLEARGRFNVGVQCYRNNAEGRRCLSWWRERCLEWCHDFIDSGRYADQGYLDAWPQLFHGVVLCRHRGVNVAPWNWITRRWKVRDGLPRVDDQTLVIFHFAALRLLARTRVDPSQVEYGVMPGRIRDVIYGPYLAAVFDAEGDIARVRPGFKARHAQSRGRRSRWSDWVLQVLFGCRWHETSRGWRAASLGLGRWSSRLLAISRRLRGSS